ncbi:hypothetical protein GQ42DRAFT_160731 [Ramicandelaber brevisporus]|nr:hypothetical protein GQ42DRAFT_160731 [Ramicandelaber brevisporus]
MENVLFNLKFTAKRLQKESKKCTKDEGNERTKLKKAIQQGNLEGARIYAANAIRKKNESLNLLRLSSRVDATASKVQTTIMMRGVTNSMVGVVKNMDKALDSLNLDKIAMLMDKFESQFEEMDVQTDYMERAMGQTVAQTMPQSEVDLLMQQVADEAGIELNMRLGEAALPSSVPGLMQAQTVAAAHNQPQLIAADGDAPAHNTAAQPQAAAAASGATAAATSTGAPASGKAAESDLMRRLEMLRNM